MRVHRSIGIWFILFSLQSAFVSWNPGAAQSLSNSGVNRPLKTSALVLYDTTEEYGMYCFAQTLISLRYARLPFHSYNLARSSDLPSLDEYTSVLITTETVWKLNEQACANLTRYVRDGGAVVVLFRGWNPNLEDLFGIAYSTAPTVIGERSRGLVFTKELLPGINNISINDRLLTDISRFDVQLDSTVSVFARTYIGDHPAAWFRRYGRGKVLFWDTSLLTTRIYRGYILASIGCVQPWTSALLLNVSNVSLDDFPLPSPNEKIEPIKSEFNETASEFYSFRWFPDLVKLGRQFGLRYTAGLIFNYSEMTKPPYAFNEWSRSQITLAGKPMNSSVWVARQASRTIELAFHGYNHQPLTLSRWGSKENMTLALQAARRRWEMDNLGPEPLGYIPPMNIIDSVGLRALVDVFPGIRVVGGQFMGNFDLGQAREFGPDPWNEHVIDVPRTTSGYEMDDFNKMMTISMIHSVGVWNHFIHPDDVIPTSGRYQESVREDHNTDVAGWYNEPKKNGLYYRFQEWLKFVRDYYPWLRSFTLTEARDAVMEYASASASVASEGKIVRFTSSLTPAHFMFYLPDNNPIEHVEGGEILHAENLAFTDYYILKSTRPTMTLTLRDSVGSVTLKGPEQGNLYSIDRSGRNDILPPSLSVAGKTIAPAAPKTMIQQVDDLIGAGKQQDAIAVLETSLRDNSNDVELWKRLRQLYDWNNLSDKAIKSGENIVRLAPNDRAALKNLAQRYVGANRQREAIPLYEKLLRADSKDMATLKALAQNYVWANRQKDAIPLYERLVKREPGNTTLRKTLADLCFWNSMNDEGIRQYEQILLIEKSDTATMRLLGEKYLEANRQADAIRIYEGLLPYEQRSSALRKRLAQLYLWNNAGGKAIEQYESIVASNKTDREARRSLARMYLENSSLDKAIPQYERIIHDEPNDVASLKRLGELYLWKERQQEAVPIFQRIVQAEPDSIPSRVMLGRLCVWTKNPGGGKAEFVEVLRRDPRNREALTLLADIERGEGEWYAASSRYGEILMIDPSNREARIGIEEIRRDHGLLLKSSYERTEDSNDLVREQVPLAAGMIQGKKWNLGLHALRQSVLDRRLALTEVGYGLGMTGQYLLMQGMSLSGSVIATSYESNWTPVSLSLQVDNVLTPRVTTALKLQRFETTEGVQAIRTRIYVSRVAGELFYQTTDRLSISGAAEVNSYSDDNTKTTVASFMTYKVRLGAPSITLLANYAYQDTRVIYRTSIPYWTPSLLSTTSTGVNVVQDLFAGLTVEAAYLHTLQAGVFSSNVRGRITLRPSMFSQIVVEYERLGSTVYSQNTVRAVLQYRY
ncbi:MAG: DUF2194 domain-containing protein [Ignavibacteriales bacterium]|nr:DUF2194 domain-containing protein [Ignavibacteriales bacterium]